MELDVTHMVEDADVMYMLSGSRVKHGQDAARITWSNSKVYAQHTPLLTTDEEREAARRHFKEYGAWSEEEIAAWSEEELQAIMVQDVAAAIREMEAHDTSEAGYDENYMGCLGLGGDGRWYYYLGI